ncbi:MAG: hypothetical protein WBH08_11120, partial [Methanothrix sp.]
MVRIMILDAIRPQYVTDHPNDIIRLFDEQDIELRCPSQGILFGRGGIEFRWSPNRSLHFELSNNLKRETLKLISGNWQDAILNVPTDPPISLDVLVNGSSLSLNSAEQKGTLRGLVSETRFDREILCDEIKFHIANLHNYFGNIIKYPPRDSWQSSARRRIALSDDNWEFTIDGVENLEDLLKELSREGGYAITHAGVLRKRDNQPFKAEEALEQIKLLGFFLSFVEGRYCHPIFLIGLRKSEIVFRDLSARHRISQWDNNWRWSPSNACDLDLAYKGFVLKWNDPQWKETITLILEFYIRANTYHVVELSILDSFMALDRLASGYSLENVRMASDRIRQALSMAGLDTKSPHTDLCQFFNDFYRRNGTGKTADGATILTDFRHGVVHGNGDKLNRPKLDEDGDSTNPVLPFPLRRYAQDYGLWCVEMSVLY